MVKQENCAIGRAALRAMPSTTASRRAARRRASLSREYKFSVARIPCICAKGQMLSRHRCGCGGRRRGRDRARDRAALGWRVVARERRMPCAAAGRGDLGEPEIWRASVSSGLAATLPSGAISEKLAFERNSPRPIMTRKRRAPPRRDRRGQDRELGRVFADTGWTLGPYVATEKRKTNDAPAISGRCRQPAAANWRTRDNRAPFMERSLDRTPAARAGLQDSELAGISQHVVEAGE